MATTLSVVSSRKAVSQLASLSARLRNMKERVEGIAPKIQAAAITMGTAFAYGKIEASFESRREAMFTVLDIPPSFLYGAALFAVGEWVGGRGGEMIHSASIAPLAIAAYKGGKESSAASVPTGTVQTADAMRAGIANAHH